MKLSVLIPVKNEQDVISDCLRSAHRADQIIVVDSSTDKTGEIAGSFPKVTVLKVKGGTFASRKNLLMAKAQSDWLFYLDGDERITPLLEEEILKVIRRKTGPSAYAVPRRNILLGKELKYGGWYPDYQMRLFKKSGFRGFTGSLHEQAQFDGEAGKLTEPLIHLQPETLEPAFQKTIRWSGIEADLLLRAGHPPIAWWRVLAMGARTFFDRCIRKQGYLDGTEGWIESVYQAYHTMIVYLRLWEMQQQKKGNREVT